MPKIVDHEARRAELAEALWRVVIREGIGGVTIRSVADEAGWSRGIVEHYFESKDELVRFACRLAAERILVKVRERHASLEGRAALRAVLLQDLGLFSKRKESVNVWMGMLSAAAREPGLTAEFVRFDEELRAVIAEMIAEMMARGEASPDIDPEEKARSLFAFNIGMAADLSFRPASYSETALEAQVDAFLDGLSG